MLSEDSEIIKDMGTFPDDFAEESKEKPQKTVSSTPISESEKQKIFPKVVEQDKELKEEDSSDDSSLIDLDINQEIPMETSIQVFTKPKHLYDCILGLQSENRERFICSFKYVNFLIRKRLGDLELHEEMLLKILLTINEMQHSFEEFARYRKRAIKSLIVYGSSKIPQ